MGYHGCDMSVYDKVVHRGELMRGSENDYDWLGPGVYFWQESEERAWRWAREPWQKEIKEPAVIQAEISLGYCMDLLRERHREELKLAYEHLRLRCMRSKIPLPENSVKFTPAHVSAKRTISRLPYGLQNAS